MDVNNTRQSAVFQDTVVALATASGVGAIAVLRLSGAGALAILGRVFHSKREKRALQGYRVYFGTIKEDNMPLDEVLVSVFRAPHSYTGEDVVEVSCHGSVYIQQALLQLFLKEGCRLAQPGEFTQRAFLNGKMDLHQAEAVADLIASENEKAHRLALNQMKSGYGGDLKRLRTELLNFASLVELELDFSEEDVDFANRTDLERLVRVSITLFGELIGSFSSGNAIKNGIPVAILGQPNVGKSTLLNALLHEERAIVTNQPGTTRDSIEAKMTINGQAYRFIDTAGLRETTDIVEQIGIERSYQHAKKAVLVLYLLDGNTLTDKAFVDTAISELKGLRSQLMGQTVIPVINKTDTITHIADLQSIFPKETLFISAKERKGFDMLLEALLGAISYNNHDVVVSNVRHLEALKKALLATEQVLEGLQSQISGDLLAIDLREALHHIGAITGEITTDDLLGNIFSKFCIGK